MWFPAYCFQTFSYLHYNDCRTLYGAYVHQFFFLSMFWRHLMPLRNGLHYLSDEWWAATVPANVNKCTSWGFRLSMVFQGNCTNAESSALRHLTVTTTNTLLKRGRTPITARRDMWLEIPVVRMLQRDVLCWATGSVSAAMGQMRTAIEGCSIY